MSKAKRIAEWILIGLFIAIVASIASILIYRSVVNSDWYTERQARKSFEQMVEKVNNDIKYIEVDDNVEYRYIYDAPFELFDDLKIKNYKRVEDIEKLLEIWRSEPCVTVFFNDNTATSFYITEDGKMYWGELFEIESPSLLDWYAEIVSKKNFASVDEALEFVEMPAALKALNHNSMHNGEAELFFGKEPDYISLRSVYSFDDLSRVSIESFYSKENFDFQTEFKNNVGDKEFSKTISKNGINYEVYIAPISNNATSHLVLISSFEAASGESCFAKISIEFFGYNSNTIDEILENITIANKQQK